MSLITTRQNCHILQLCSMLTSRCLKAMLFFFYRFTEYKNKQNIHRFTEYKNNQKHPLDVLVIFVFRKLVCSRNLTRPNPRANALFFDAFHLLAVAIMGQYLFMFASESIMFFFSGTRQQVKILWEKSLLSNI